MKNNENNILKIFPVSLNFKNNSIQASFSKDFSLIKPKVEKLDLFRKNNNNSSNFININNYFNNSSSSSAREQSIEGLKEKIFSAGLRTGFNYISPINNKTSFRTLKYRPKRLINFSNLKSDSKINKVLYSKAFVNFEKKEFDPSVFNNKKLENNDKIRAKSTNNILSSSKNKINLDFINKDNTINNKNIINFKTTQITLFSKFSNNYNNLKKYLSFTSNRTKAQLDSFLSKLGSIVESQRNILFIDNDDYYYFNSYNFDKDNIKNNIKTNNINLEEKKCKYLFNNQVMFKFLNINAEYNSLLYNCLETVFNELKEVKENNMELTKANYEAEILLNMKNKELKEINKYLNSSRTKALILNSKSKEKIIKELNVKFNKKENKYLINMYKLNEEIKDLLFLLEKNKEYYNKYKEMEKKQKLNISEVKSIRNHLNYQLDKKNAQYQNELEVNEELNDQIYKLEENINELKDENSAIKLHEIEMNSQIKKLYMIISERNENINMINEELNYFYMKYNKEIKEHENTKIMLQQIKDKFEIKRQF